VSDTLYFKERRFGAPKTERKIQCTHGYSDEVSNAYCGAYCTMTALKIMRVPGTMCSLNAGLAYMDWGSVRNVSSISYARYRELDA